MTSLGQILGCSITVMTESLHTHTHKLITFMGFLLARIQIRVFVYFWSVLFLTDDFHIFISVMELYSRMNFPIVTKI